MAEPLLDLKEGIDQLENNKTLGFILSTLLAIGNFLNGTNVSLSHALSSYLPCHKIPALHVPVQVIPQVLQSTIDKQLSYIHVEDLEEILSLKHQSLFIWACILL